MLPEHLKIGFEVYRVSTGTADFELQGECDTEHATIVLTGKATPRRRAAILLHEILHACWDQAELGDLGDDAREEQIINRLAPVLSQVLMDNASLLDCLNEAGQNGNSTCYGLGGIDRESAKLWRNEAYTSPVDKPDNEQRSEQQCSGCLRSDGTHANFCRWTQ